MKKLPSAECRVPIWELLFTAVVIFVYLAWFLHLAGFFL
jgi:hypothetical protein